jgi:hypothetical protein
MLLPTYIGTHWRIEHTVVVSFTSRQIGSKRFENGRESMVVKCVGSKKNFYSTVDVASGKRPTALSIQN